MIVTDHYAMRLNNFLQGRYGPAASRNVRYEATHHGPENHTVWEGIYFINDAKYGTGTGSSKKIAKEAAAKNTIGLLVQEGNVIS